MGVTDSAMGHNVKARVIDSDGGYNIVEGHHYVKSYIVLVIYAILGTEEQSIRMQRVSVAGGGRTRPLPSRRCIGIRCRRALATECDVLRIGVGRAVDLCSDNPFNVPCLGTHGHRIVCVAKKRQKRVVDVRRLCVQRRSNAPRRQWRTRCARVLRTDPLHSGSVSLDGSHQTM